MPLIFGMDPNVALRIRRLHAGSAGHSPGGSSAEASWAPSKILLELRQKPMY